jgi:hypothetical protein
MNHREISTPEMGTVHAIELVCADFDSEVGVRYSNKCSEGCAEGMKMFFTPRLHGSTIHAQVCAGRWEFVNKLSKEWWARKAATVLGWDEDKIREQIDPVWASKVHAANISRTWTPGRKSPRKGGASCLVCGKSVSKGVDVCNQCTEDNEGPKVDAGSVDDLEI